MIDVIVLLVWLFPVAVVPSIWMYVVYYCRKKQKELLLTPLLVIGFSLMVGELILLINSLIFFSPSFYLSGFLLISMCGFLTMAARLFS